MSEQIAKPEMPRPRQEQEHDEELHLRFPGDRRAEAGASMSASAMLRRLPHLVRRALALAWAADRTSTALLLVCQALAGVFGALALYATTGTLGALGRRVSARGVPRRRVACARCGRRRPVR
ncbi:hypothetical protein [Kitasatospora sp. NPDC087314]|uniref:hypothetical protein n=1 Tax=Kitasatospora sp. NPDC087314 TaxID=3364068 RepID=UPI0038306079